jgi:hypothetical protein
MSNLTKFAPWSQTKLETANRCSLRFKWEYVTKAKKYAVPASAGRIGAGAHKILELMLKGENFDRAFNIAGTDNKLTFNELESLACFKDAITEFLTRIAKWKLAHPVEQEVIELKFGIDESLKPVGFWDKTALFRGAWDLGLKLKDKTLVILDHKSGAEKSMDNYTDQLNIYAASGLVLHPDITGVDTRIHYLQTKNIANGPLISAEKIRNEILPWLLTYIEQTTITLLGEEAKPTKSWACSYCPFKPVCPAWTTAIASETEVPLNLEVGDKNNI